MPERPSRAAEKVAAGLGDAILFCTRDRLVPIGGVYGLQPVKHGVAEITAGRALSSACRSTSTAERNPPHPLSSPRKYRGEGLPGPSAQGSGFTTTAALFSAGTGASWAAFFSFGVSAVSPVSGTILTIAWKPNESFFTPWNGSW